MSSSHIAGVGMTAFGRRNEPFVELARQAVDDLDARLRRTTRPDHILLASAFPASYGDTANAAAAVTDALGLAGTPATRVETAPSSSLAALEVADALVRSGRRGRVLVLGVETMTRLPTDEANRVLAKMAPPDERLLGLTMAAQVALMTRAYMDRFGVDHATLLESPHKAHAYGEDNRLAHFQKAVSLATMLEAPEVSDPLRRYDCAPLSDGAAAFLVTATPGPVRVAGIGHATDRWPLATRPQPDALVSFSATTAAARAAFAEANIAPSKIDLVETHDAFSVLEAINLEDLGFFDKGTGATAIADGATRRDGDLPTNPGGGLKARGHPVGATGAAQVCELFWQLTGDEETRTRQVDDATTGLAHNIGGLGNNVLVSILEATA